MCPIGLGTKGMTMPRELNGTAPWTLISDRYRVSINNGGCLHIVQDSIQLQLNRDESHQFLAFLLNNSTENAGEPPAHGNANL